MTPATTINPTQKIREQRGQAALALGEFERVAVPDALDQTVEQIEGFPHQLDGSAGAAECAIRALRLSS